MRRYTIVVVLIALLLASLACGSESHTPYPSAIPYTPQQDAYQQMLANKGEKLLGEMEMNERVRVYEVTMEAEYYYEESMLGCAFGCDTQQPGCEIKGNISV